MTIRVYLTVHPDSSLTPQQSSSIKCTLGRIKEKLNRLSTDHKDLHVNINIIKRWHKYCNSPSIQGTVSKVGKAIDRNFIYDYISIAPRLELFQEDHNIQLLNRNIAKHFYRSGKFEFLFLNFSNRFQQNNSSHRYE